MSSTGVDSFTNPHLIGPLYPGVGFEWLMVLIAFVLWLLWHVIQISGEEEEYSAAVKLYREVGMERAMHHATGAIATEEEVHISKS